MKENTGGNILVQDKSFIGRNSSQEKSKILLEGVLNGIQSQELFQKQLLKLKNTDHIYNPQLDQYRHKAIVKMPRVEEGVRSDTFITGMDDHAMVERLPSVGEQKVPAL